jgi:hypothetical protein
MFYVKQEDTDTKKSLRVFWLCIIFGVLLITAVSITVFFVLKPEKRCGSNDSNTVFVVSEPSMNTCENPEKNNSETASSSSVEPEETKKDTTKLFSSTVANITKVYAACDSVFDANVLQGVTLPNIEVLMGENLSAITFTKHFHVDGGVIQYSHPKGIMVFFGFTNSSAKKIFNRNPVDVGSIAGYWKLKDAESDKVFTVEPQIRIDSTKELVILELPSYFSPPASVSSVSLFIESGAQFIFVK